MGGSKEDYVTSEFSLENTYQKETEFFNIKRCHVELYDRFRVLDISGILSCIQNQRGFELENRNETEKAIEHFARGDLNYRDLSTKVRHSAPNNASFVISMA